MLEKKIKFYFLSPKNGHESKTFFICYPPKMVVKISFFSLSHGREKSIIYPPSRVVRKNKVFSPPKTTMKRKSLLFALSHLVHRSLIKRFHLFGTGMHYVTLAGSYFDYPTLKVSLKVLQQGKYFYYMVKFKYDE